MVAALRMDSVALLPSFVGVLDLKTGRFSQSLSASCFYRFQRSVSLGWSGGIADGHPVRVGVIVVTLFGLLNKVAGVYGMMAVFTGGSWLQLSYYSYSIVMIGVFLWGLKRVSGVCLFRPHDP